MLLARAGLPLTRQPLMWGLPGAGAVLTPAGAGLFAQMPIGPNQIDPNQIGQGAGVLPQAQRGWWHRLLEVCGMQNLSGQRLVSGSQGPEPLFGMARQGLAQRVWQPEQLALPQALASRQAVDVALRE